MTRQITQGSLRALATTIPPVILPAVGTNGRGAWTWVPAISKPPVSADPYAAGRHRLSAELVVHSDVDEFEGLLRLAATVDGDERICVLEQAPRLYRGDYLDDCPYYSDSAQVESRRQVLREVHLQANQELTAAYMARGLRALGMLRAFEVQRLAPSQGGWTLQPVPLDGPGGSYSGIAESIVRPSIGPFDSASPRVSLRPLNAADTADMGVGGQPLL